MNEKHNAKERNKNKQKRNENKKKRQKFQKEEILHDIRSTGTFIVIFVPDGINLYNKCS